MGERRPAVVHRTWVEFRPDDGNFAVCTCGWRGRPEVRPAAAMSAVKHAREGNST